MKGRSNKTYQNKLREITKWYNNIVKNRQPKNTKDKDKKPLQSLKFFTDKIKKPNISKREYAKTIL